MAGKIQNEDIKSVADLTGAGGSASQLPNDTKVYVTANGINDTLYNAILNGQIGGGGSGGINFLTLDSAWESTKKNNMDAEVSVGDWVALANATTNTVGSPNITLSRTTTGGEVLDGAASFKVVKTATNYQNQGVGCNAYIPLGFRGQNLSFNIPFKIISGSVVQGDLKVYAYDVTNSQMLDLINSDVIINNGILTGTFVIASSTAQIRFGFYFASTAATAVTFSYDDVFVTQNKFIIGMTGTDWKLLDGLTASAGYNSPTLTFYYRQVGDSIQARGYITQTAAASATVAYLQLPFTIDSSKFSTGTNLGLVGSWYFNRSPGTPFGTSNFFGTVFYDGSDTNKLFFAYQGSSNNFAKANADDTTTTTSNTCVVEFTVPIQGLSTGLITQNTGTFSIANVLANGTRVTGTAPTKLGEYRSYLRNANAQTYTETNGTPQDLPTDANGARIYTSSLYNTADPNNQPSRYEIFIGKNVFYSIEYFLNTGRTGDIDTGPQIFSTYCSGIRHTYDPTTGILILNTNTLNGSANLVIGQGPDSLTSYWAAYFDIFVSQNPIPVQFNLQKVIISDHKASGTDGGTASAGNWVQRDLNTIENQQPWVSINSNQITLDPGTYEYDIWAPALGVQSHKVRLYNVTSSTVVAYGTSEYSLDSGSSTTPSHVSGTVTITAQSIFKIEHWCTTNGSTYAFGANCNISGVDEIYTVVELRKVR